jgi:hypothetical protein
VLLQQARELCAKLALFVLGHWPYWFPDTARPAEVRPKP